MIAFGGARFLLEAIEVCQGQRQLALLDPALSSGQEQAKTTLSHLRMHAVDRLGLGEEVECLAHGATALSCTDQVEQRLQVLGMGAAPGLRCGFSALGLTLIIMRHEGAKHLGVGVRFPSPLQ